jgi:hypothetical protein
MSHDFNNGSPSANTNYFNTNWRLDTMDASFVALTPDANDSLYEVDGPNIASFGNSSTSETYNNFYNYITWNGQTCSSTNNFWYFSGRWNVTNTPQVTYTALGAGTITLPTNAFYKH